MLSPERSRGLARWTVASTFALGLMFFMTFRPLEEPMDFRAFYCAGAALAQRADPYRMEPDRTCQRSVLAASGLRLDERFVIPAPLPPYALMGFAALSRLPFRAAAELWFVLGTLALVAAIVLLSELSGAPVVLAGAALVASAGYASLVLGQVVPIVLAAALFATLRARRGDGSGAALAAGVASLEPHLALPLWLGLFCLPCMRRPLVIAAVCICALTLLPGGALDLEYVRSVLPLHARSELLNYSGQYSLSSLLVALGIPFQRALQAGSLDYAAMLAGGLAAGATLWKRSADPAYVVVTPLAAVVLGGPFLHVTQTAVALPLAFLLLALALAPLDATLLRGALVAICLLATPWQLVERALHAHAMPPVGLRGTRVAAIVPSAPDESIELPYTRAVDAFERRAVARHAFAEETAWKLPTWLALIVLLGCAAWTAYRLDRTNEERPPTSAPLPRRAGVS